MTSNPFRLTDWQWFKLRLRLEALERRTSGISYSFEVGAANLENKDIIGIKCYMYYDPNEVRIEPASDEERAEIFLSWRSTVVHMIEEALSDTPELSSRISVKGSLSFIVLEGYGMGSKKVFEAVGNIKSPS